MTITSQTTKVVALGDDITTEFDYAFLIPDAASVEVIYTDLAGVDNVLIPAQYTITGVGETVGGTVTYPLVGSPIPTGTTLTIARDAAIVQLTALNNQGGFYPESVENALDYLTILIQQVNEQDLRSLVAPITEPAVNLVIPTIAQRANMLLGFDSLGDPTAVSEGADAPVSAPMKPVVAAASLASARSLLGLGEFSTLDIGDIPGSGFLSTVALPNPYIQVNFATNSIAISTAITAASHLQRYIVTSTGVTLTLPRANTLWNGFSFWVENAKLLNDTVTIAIDSHDSFQNGSSGTSIVIPAGYKAFITTDGAATGLWLISEITQQRAPLPAVEFRPPQGRLTLTTGVPVLIADVTAADTIYYTPYIGTGVYLYVAGNWQRFNFTELSQALSDNTKSPAAAAANKIYDMFIWLDGTTIRCTRGPAWASDTSRGTGAGTSQLIQSGGVYVNQFDITNGPTGAGPSSNSGLYIGTIATDGSSQLNMMMLPAAAASGSNNYLGVWNMYNRVKTSSVMRSSTDSWAYTTATWRSAGNSDLNRIKLVRGLDEDAYDAEYVAHANNATANVSAFAGVGLDSTTAIMLGSSPGISPITTSAMASARASGSRLLGLGLHYIQALEASTAAGTTTWYGDNGNALFYQMSLTVRGMM